MKIDYLSALLGLLFCPLAGADPVLPDIKEGLWELTFQSDIIAQSTPMPSIAYTSQRCLTRQTAADPHVLMQNKQCEISDLQSQLTQISWDMLCQQQGIPMMGAGRVSYTEETLSGSFTMAKPGEAAKALKITSKISGRYVGNCQ